MALRASEWIVIGYFAYLADAADALAGMGLALIGFLISRLA